MVHASLLSRVPENVTCWRHWAIKSLEGIAWGGDWQRIAQESGTGEAVHALGP